MTVKQKREMLVEMCKIREELKTNEQLVQEVIHQRLAFLPHQKLYKFRTCSNQNLKTLEENCIWMSLASSFHDSFDNTINIDPKENVKEIEKWLKENYPVFCFDLAKSFCEQRGIAIPYTHDDFKEYIIPRDIFSKDSKVKKIEKEELLYQEQVIIEDSNEQEDIYKEEIVKKEEKY